MKNTMKLEITAISENESFARSAVAAFALPLNPSISDLSDIKTSVSEAVTNCIVHAYKKNEEGIILIECEIEKNERKGQLHITVTDYGLGIDNIELALQPFYTTLSDDERSGMGFTIMQTFMTNFKVESSKGNGTKVYMSKEFNFKDGVDV